MNKDILCRLLDHTTSQEELVKELNHFCKPNWENLFEASTWHGIKPLVYLRLKPLFGKVTIPSSIQNDLRDAYIHSVRKNILILHHAGKLLKTLKAYGIDVIGLKGIYLVENIYENIAIRSFGDIDIMVRKKDLQETINSLQELGYRISTYFSMGDLNIDIKHVPPMIKDDGLTIEIHWTILQENEPFTMDMESLWDRAISANIAGIDVLSLSPEDLILHLCMHLTYQHRLKLGLRGLYDIAKVLEYYQGQVNWTMLIEISKAWGVERVTWLSLILAQDLLGAQIPPIIEDHLKPKDVAPWVVVEAKEKLLHQVVSKVVMTPDLAEFAAKKGLISRIKLLFSRVFLPKQTLARIYNVSPKSIKIYGCYFKRLIYLLIHFGESLNRVAKKDPQVQVEVKNEIAIEKLKKWMVNK